MGKRTSSFVFASVLTMALTLALASCSGGGGSSGNTPDNPSGVPTPVSKSVTLTWTRPTTNTDGTALDGSQRVLRFSRHGLAPVLHSDANLGP